MSDNTDKEPSMVDAEPARKRLVKLYSMGYTKKEIERFHVSNKTQHKIIDVKTKTIRRDVYERIFAIKGRKLSSAQKVPADAARHMLVTWCKTGIPVTTIARVIGTSQQVIGSIKRGEKKMIYAKTLLAMLEHRKELDEMAREKSARKKSSEE